MRKLIVGLVALVLLALVVGIGALAYVRSGEQPREGMETVTGLRAPVEVIWTDHAVPHVFAGSLHDAVFAQGFLHARDRLWQMELVRRAIQGRLAEVLGEPALETDRFLRRVGLWDAARRDAAAMPPDDRALLQAYADGVNAALERWSGPLPPEFLVLGFEPEPWAPVHTIAVAKMLSLTLASYGQSLAVARALRRLPRDRARWLFPEFPDWDATILPPAPEIPPLARSLVDRYSFAAASNSWVVDGSRTASGRPILANDMHLELQAPSLWYMAGLHAPATDTFPALDAVGTTVAGAPLVVAGRNRAIAWGYTNAYVDDVDLFIERVDPADSTRYLTPDGSRPFEVRAETLSVKGREAPVVMDIRRTRHGPVMPVGDGRASGDTVLAMRWTAHDPTTAIRGLFRLNLARDWPGFLEAADLLDEPHQNLVYADTAGHIGYVLAGTVPIRGDRRPATVVPRPGWTGEWDWTGALPFDEHPRTLDPAAGYVVTANNRQTAEPVAELISDSWLQPFRAMRITEMIVGAGPGLTADDIHAMQLDVYDLYAERYVDRAIEAADSAGLTDVAASLRAWDLRATGASRAAPLFYAWNEILRRELARDIYGGAPSYFTRESATVVLEERAVPWASDPGSAYRRLADRAIREAARVAGDRTWAESNRAVHTHTLGDVAILDRILGLDIGPMPHHGSPFTVNVAHWGFQSPHDDFPFLTTAGVSMRHVAELGNTEATAGFVIPTGQSGLPFSRYYDDQTGLWRTGRLLTLSLGRDAVEASAEQRLRLDPVERDDRR